MNSTIQATRLLLAAVAMLTGCRNKLPCPDCDDHADEVDIPHEDEAPLPDLPWACAATHNCAFAC